ncbi:MAG: hypothetical protein ACYDBY_13195 [Thermoanaerobaculia bacterium]
MRSIASLALALALVAAPAALAGPDCAGHAKAATCCTKKAGTAADKKCDPANCKDAAKCTHADKAKCAEACAKKAEAPKPAKG